MNKFSNVEEEFIALIEKPVDVTPILLKYLSFWKWFVVSILLFLSIAIIYIYFTLPNYNIATSIVFRDDQRGGGITELNVFKDMGVVTRRSNVDNEVEILKKSLIVESVVRELGLYANYIEIKPIIPLNINGINLPHRKYEVLYGKDNPLNLILSEGSLNIIEKPIRLLIEKTGKENYMLSGVYKKQKFNVIVAPNDTLVKLPFGDVILNRGNVTLKNRSKIRVEINHPRDVANSYLDNLDIELTSKTSSVADIKLKAYNIDLGKDFLDNYIETYNENGIRDQSEIAAKTSQVIENHLANLSNELSEVENQTQDFRQSRGLTNIASQADLYNSQLASISQIKMDVESQYSIVSDLLRIVEQNGIYQAIPASSGIKSMVLNDQITTYNNLVIDRNKLARIASSSNQSMINLNSQLETTFNSVVSGLRNEKNSLEIQLRDINSEYSRNSAKIWAIPQQERAFSDLKRQQNIKEDLFLYLLQKKEERYMNMTSVEPNSRMIDNIHVMGVSWPNNILILLIAMIMGMVIPFIGIKVRDLLRYQIDTKEDLEDISSIAILGEIPKTVQTEVVAVKEGANDSFNEMMRLLRANLLFVIDGKENKVINMLSSISGEGKSFVLLNLAMSLAILDKKVLIVELDIRKPKLANELNLNNKQGITLYLSGHLDKSELVNPSGLHPNLSIITAGAIPPNPNELLAKPILDDLINEMRQEYDYVLIDTPPVGLVSDSFLLNRLTDVNLYVARVGYTPKKLVENADQYFKENRLKKMYFILNYVDLNSTEYRYGLGKKYGYGYS